MSYLIVATRKITTASGWEAFLIDQAQASVMYDAMLAHAREHYIDYDSAMAECHTFQDGESFYKETETIDDYSKRIMRSVGFRKCDICGAWVTPQDRDNHVSIYDGIIRRCGACQAKHELECALTPRKRKIKLADYHSTALGNNIFQADDETYTMDNVIGLGIEFEFNNGSARLREIESTQDFYRYAGPHSRSRLFRCERDATVSGEIITNIITKKWLLAHPEFYTIICDQLKLVGNREGAENTGLHVHISIGIFGQTENERAKNLLKLLLVVNAYEDDFLKISGRTTRNNMYWCSFATEQQLQRYLERYRSQNLNLYDFQSGHGCTGCAIIPSRNTIEWRIGSSTNDPERIRHYIALVYGITEAIAKTPVKKLFCLRKLMRFVPDDTQRYWRNKGAFLKTAYNEENGGGIDL